MLHSGCSLQSFEVLTRVSWPSPCRSRDQWRTRAHTTEVGQNFVQNRQKLHQEAPHKRSLNYECLPVVLTELLNIGTRSSLKRSCDAWRTVEINREALLRREKQSLISGTR